MALSITSVVANVGSLQCVKTSATCTADVLKASSGKLYKIEIDNTANSAVCYVKLYDTTSGVTHASTDPHWCLICPGSSLRVYTIANGSIFATGMKALCATQPGTGTTTTVNPSSPVIYRILLS